MSSTQCCCNSQCPWSCLWCVMFHMEKLVFVHTFTHRFEYFIQQRISCILYVFIYITREVWVICSSKEFKLNVSSQWPSLHQSGTISTLNRQEVLFKNIIWSILISKLLQLKLHTQESRVWRTEKLCGQTAFHSSGVIAGLFWLALGLVYMNCCAGVNLWHVYWSCFPECVIHLYTVVIHRKIS